MPCTHKDFLISLYAFFRRWDYRSAVAALKDESSWYYCGKLQNRRLCLHLKLVVWKNGYQIQPHLLLTISNLNLSWTQLAACLNEAGKHMLTQSQGHPPELTTDTYAPEHAYVWVKMWQHHLKFHLTFQFRLPMPQHWGLKFWNRLGNIIFHPYQLSVQKAYSYCGCAVQFWYILTNRKESTNLKAQENLESLTCIFMTSKWVACGFWKVGPISPKILQIFYEF